MAGKGLKAKHGRAAALQQAHEGHLLRAKPKALAKSLMDDSLSTPVRTLRIEPDGVDTVREALLEGLLVED